MSEPTSFDDFVIHELLEAKAKWLGILCAALIPPSMARMDRPGNLDACREFLKQRNAVIKDYHGGSEVWVKGRMIGAFVPRLEDGKLVLEASVANLRVDVGAPVVPPQPATN